MRTFTINSENNITVFASEKQAKASDAMTTPLFTSQADLAKLAADWPISRLVEIWNSIPGFKPVKKFTDRKTAIARIWKAIQSLDDGTEQEDKTALKTGAEARHVAPKRAPKQKAARKAKGRKKAASGVRQVREGSKTAAILDLVRRPKGATLEELMAAAGWQAHSVRGFLSAVVGKKMGLKLHSIKREDGKRAYQIAS